MSSPTKPTSETKLVDADGDGLDDRLVDIRIPQNETIHDVILRLDMIQLRTLPAETLEQMLNNIEQDQNRLLEKARTLERYVHENIVHGKFSILEGMRREVRLLNKEYEGLQEQYNRVYNTLQATRLENNMHRIIGKRSSKMLEVVVLVLIVFVLTLLMYDLSVVRAPTHILNPWNIFYIDSVCCLVFLGEFFFRMYCADNKKWFVRNNWIDFVTSIPIPPAEGSRWVRLGRLSRFARFLRILRLLRLLRLVYFFWRGMDKLNDLFDVRMMKKSLKWGLFVIVVGGIAIWKIEGEQEGLNAGVEDLARSIWWSFTTVVTGGFGDIHNPSSLLGQFVTGLLVIAGMILIGVFTATLTSLYVGEETDELSHLSDNLSKQINDMKQELLNRIDAQQQIIDSLKDRDP